MSKKRLLIIGAIMALTYNCYVMNVWCQEPEPKAKTLISKKVEKHASSTTFWGMVKQGGITMFPLGLLFAATIGLTVYGFMATKEKKMLNPELIPSLNQSLDNLDIDLVSKTCASNPCLLTNILLSGMQRLKDGVLDTDSMEKAMEEASVEETSAGLKPINYLSIVAQIAPMLGLLGTVSGMIKAFDKIGQGGMGKPELLAGDIGEAMITTATGLIIGIPAMFFYFFLKGKYLTNVSKLARYLGNLTHTLVAASRRGN